MAISRVQTKKGNSGAVGGTSLVVTFDAPPTAGNIIIAAACYFGTSLAPGAGAGSVSATNITWSYFGSTAAQAASQGNVMLAIGRVFASPGSAVTLTHIATGGSAMVLAEYSGVSALFDKSAGANGTGTAAASGATATTEAAVQLWAAVIGSRNEVTFSSPTNGFSIVDQDKSGLATSAGRSVALLELIASSTGTPNAGATISASNIWCAQVATFGEPAAGGGGTVNPLHGKL